jgi:hypothetical protein
MSDGSIETELDAEASSTAWLRRNFRNVVGVGLIIVAGLTFLVVRDARKADLVVDCEGLRTQELEQSRDYFVASSEVEIARLRLQRDQIRDRFNAALDAVADAGQRARAVAALEEQQPDGESTSDAEEAWIAARADLDRVHDEFASLQGLIRNKNAAMWRAIRATPDNIASRPFVTLQRSDLTFAPDEATAKIHFGSSRNAKRVEVAFTAQEVDRTGSEAAMASSADGDPVTSSGLPEAFWFSAHTDQLRRSSGLTIPASDVTTWARMFGDRIFLSVCVDPDERLDAGRYEGSAYIADPSLSGIAVPVEVTAQTSLINWTLWTLLISPVLAFMFVWVKLRHAAAADASFDSADFTSWIRQNFVLSYVLGFGAVWATLQVPLNNETFGDSFAAAAAAIGVTLVAAVGAITPVVGRVVDHLPTHVESDGVVSPAAGGPAPSITNPDMSET